MKEQQLSRGMMEMMLGVLFNEAATNHLFIMNRKKLTLRGITNISLGAIPLLFQYPFLQEGWLSVFPN